MYRYFMGKKSNLYTRKSSEPVVIATERNAMRMIEQWLRKYLLDFDQLILAIEAVVQWSTIKIEWVDAQDLLFFFEEGKTSYVTFEEGEKPRIGLKMGENEYLIQLSEHPETLTCCVVIDSIRFGYMRELKRIFFNKGKNTILLDLEQFDLQIYEAIKEHIEELEEWENLLSLVLFVRSLPVGLHSYELLLIQRDEISMDIIKLFIIQDEIFRYHFGNETGQYIVDNDKSWEVIFEGVVFKYNLFEKKVNIYVPKNLKKYADKYEQCIPHFTDLLKTMFSTMFFINGILKK